MAPFLLEAWHYELLVRSNLGECLPILGGKTLGGVLALLFAFGASAEISVQFIRQTHRPPGGVDLYSEGVARSQFEVFLRLAKSPGSTVFLEGRTRDTTIEDRSVQDVFGRPKDFAALFPPDIVRSSFESLSQKQRSQLYRYGGANIAFYLGYVRVLKATDDKSKLNETHEWLLKKNAESKYDPEAKQKQEELFSSAEFRERIIVRREREAISRMKHYLQSPEYHREPVFIVFGGQHQFEEASEILSPFSLTCEATLQN